MNDNIVKRNQKQTVITVMMDEIPVEYSDIDFEQLGMEHLGIALSDYETAELVRIVSISLGKTKILKDRYGYKNTKYYHK